MNWLRGTRAINLTLVSELFTVLLLLPRPHLRLNMENSSFPNTLDKTISPRQCHSLSPFLFIFSTCNQFFLSSCPYAPYPVIIHSSLFSLNCPYLITYSPSYRAFYFLFLTNFFRNKRSPPLFSSCLL